MPKCDLIYKYTGGRLTRTSERHPPRTLTREEALRYVHASYQLKILEHHACTGKSGQATYPVSFGGRLVVKRTRRK